MAMPEIPAQYVLSPFAPEPRTLIDILYATAARYPDAAAIDDGSVQLTYRELIADIEDSVEWLAARGIGRGDRIGIRMPSGSYALYVAILATLAAGAAYVPVDADDPEERAELVFGEANVVAVITEQGLVRATGASRGWRAAAPLARDDAWIIFTSGSTGTPKGVAVTHRSAAAFVDAEAQMFLQDNPIGPGDRVLAGLSVAFDASCEEMWLAWRHGACLVPAPRSLVRSGMDLGPVAGVPGHHRGVDGADAGGVVAGRGAGGGAAADLRRRGLPAGARRAAGGRRAGKCGTPTAPPRPPSSPARPSSTARGRSASGCRCPAGTWRWSTRTACRSASARSANW